MTDNPDGAFEALHREHYRAVLAYARRRVPAAEADDVVAETFTAAWRNLHRVLADPLSRLFGVVYWSALSLSYWVKVSTGGGSSTCPFKTPSRWRWRTSRRTTS